MFSQVRSRQESLVVAQPKQSFDCSSADEFDRISRKLPKKGAGVRQFQPSKAGGGDAADPCALVSQCVRQRRGAFRAAEFSQSAGRECANGRVRIID
jgi:hypothetical protein